MIAVFFDSKLERLGNEIRYTIDTVFQTLGLSYRYVSRASDFSERDILICYGLVEPLEHEIHEIAHNHVIFYIPCEPVLYQTSEIRNLGRLKREMKLRHTLPVLSERPFDQPFRISDKPDYYYGVFNFDILGNLFFHLSNAEETFPHGSDRFNRPTDDSSPFIAHSSVPYVNELLWVIESFILEGIAKQPCLFVKKEMWPGGEPLAAAISHNIDHLQKWTFATFFRSLLDEAVFFVFLKWKRLFQSIGGKLRYIFTNYEPYWNFDILTEIEEKHDLKTTYFFGVEHEVPEDTDYKPEDENLREIAEEILKAGNEISLLGSYASLKNDILPRQKEKLQKAFGVKEIGVRQNFYRYDPKSTPQNHDNLNVIYDSSRAYSERPGFRNGLAFPYRIYSPTLKQSYRFLEMPLQFSDRLLHLSRYKTMPFANAQNIVRSLVQTMRECNGLLVFEFNISNFAEIPYNKRLYTFTADVLKQQPAHLDTLSGIARWWKQRQYIEVTEHSDEIVVFFPEAVRKFTLRIEGFKNILSVTGAPHVVRKNAVTFNQVELGSTATIKLHAVLSENLPEAEPESPVAETPEV
jgi:hypothetical protein